MSLISIGSSTFLVIITQLINFLYDDQHLINIEIFQLFKI